MRRPVTVAVAALVTPLLLASPAVAGEGSIDHVEPGRGDFQVFYSMPTAAAGARPDLESVEVDLNGTALQAEAEYAEDAEVAVRRTAILAVDVSTSMRKDERFGEAQRAAKIFLDRVPRDLYVGIVTFAGEVRVAQRPSLDRDASEAVIDGLTLSNQTRLYDGVLDAVEAAGDRGSRSVLVLSDGRDTSETALTRTTAAIENADLKVDVVALAQSEEDEALLSQLATAGNGSLLSAEDPQALAAVFADEANALAQQMLVTVQAPADAGSAEGTLSVSVDADGETFTDTAFVTVAAAGSPSTNKTPAVRLQPAPAPRFAVSREVMLAGVGAAGLGVLLILLIALGGLGGTKRQSVQSRVEAYTRRGAQKAQAKAQQSAPQGVAASAVSVAEKALAGREDLSSALGVKLEAAGVAMKPAEWVLLHFAVAFVAALTGLLLGSGSILLALLGLFFGALGPWGYLSFKKGRRLKRFKAQLADTLQLMAGSLSAGLSLAQSVDTVVREGTDPISTEFRRALMETRLGVEIEDALASIADRMGSKDFEWVVMAIRIQREVGGNLSELLISVATTIREREYLERQVLALSAEGRLSVWILGGLPPGFLAYLLMANREYLQPLITTLVGYVLLGVMAVLLCAGILWMKKLVKVEV